MSQAQVPALERIPGAVFDLAGPLGRRLAANEAQWLLTAPDANPAMLQILRDRDREPVRDLLPWSGEFAGKYLASAVQCWRLTRTEGLHRRIAAFVAELLATQAPDGYLGVHPQAHRLTNDTVRPDGTLDLTWDAWNHYHIMLGLLLWYDETGEPDALAACRRAADLICDTFLGTGRRLVAPGREEMNIAPIHALCLLHQRTGEPRYLAMAKAIEADLAVPTGGDYIRGALAGVPFHRSPMPRWESLHAIQGVAALHMITGKAYYREAFEQIWWSIAQGDRHNTGGFSSGERATGNPYDPSPIETCCTVAWTALTVDMLRLTGLSVAADELELSLFNAVLGAQSPTGRWWTYNTPMDGERRASAHDVVFQARAGSPELNCCSVNGPRALGMVSDWAVMVAEDATIAVNLYGPGTIEVPLPTGTRMSLHQETEYPRSGRILLRLGLPQAERVRLALRVPSWSQRTSVAVAGTATQGVAPRSYLVLDRVWEPGDMVEVSLDMSPWLWVGEGESAGRASIYRGPLLLAFDPRNGTLDPDDVPTLTPQVAAGMEVSNPAGGAIDPMLLARLATPAGEVVLCDFASAGVAGNPYRTWLALAGGEPAEFTRANPLRLVR